MTVTETHLDRMREYLSSECTPNFLRQIINYPDYKNINPNNYPTDIIYDQYDSHIRDHHTNGGNKPYGPKSVDETVKPDFQKPSTFTRRTSVYNSSNNHTSAKNTKVDNDDAKSKEAEIAKYNNEVLKNYNMNGSSASSAASTSSIDDLHELDPKTRLEYQSKAAPKQGVTNTVSAYKHYFERLSTDSKMHAHDNVSNDIPSSNSDAVATYFAKHKIYKPLNSEAFNKKQLEKLSRLHIDEEEITEDDGNRTPTPSPEPSYVKNVMNDDEESNSKFYMDADKFQICISPEIFSPVKIPAIAYYSSEKVLNEAYILGGLVKMSDEEYYDYLKDLTDNFSISPENIKVIFDYDLPLPLSSHLLTNLSVKLNDTVYKYSPSSNTLSILMKLLNSPSKNGSKSSVSSSSLSGSSSSSKKRYKDPPQLLSMSSARISKYHIAMYGGFELVTDVYKYKDINGHTKVELTKRIVPHNQLYVLDTLNISFKEIDISVPPAYSQVWAETISRFGQSLTGIPIEENNGDSDSLDSAYDSDTDLQLSNSSMSAKSPSSGNYSRYTRPAVIYCFAGYKMVDSIAADGSGRIKHSFVAMNDLWQAEVFLSKSTSSFEFGDEMIVFPTGKFDLIYSPFNHLFNKSSETNEYETVNDVDSLEGYEKFDPEYATTVNQSRDKHQLPKEPAHRKFTGIYEYRDGDWPSPRAYFGFQMIDKSQLYEGYTDFTTGNNSHSSRYNHDSSSVSTNTDNSLNSPTGHLNLNTNDSTNLYHPQPYPAGSSRSPIQRKASPAISSISNSLLQQRTSPSQKHKKAQFQQPQYSSLLSSEDSGSNNPPSGFDSLHRRGSESSVGSSNQVFSPSSTSAVDHTHNDINSTSNSSSGINAPPQSISRNLANKCLLVHGGSTKRYYKDVKTGQTYYKNDILGDLWVFFIATKTWVQLDTFSHPNIYERLNSRLFDERSEGEEVEPEEKYRHIPKAVDALTRPISFGVCGHQSVVAGSNYFLIGGFHKFLFGDDMFSLKSVDSSKTIEDDKIVKFIEIIDKKSELFDEKDAPLDFHQLLRTQIEREIIPRPYSRGMFVYRTFMLHLSKQTWKLMDFFHPSIEAIFPGEVKDSGYTPGVILFEDRMILIGGHYLVGEGSQESGISDWIAECYTPVLTLSQT